MNLDELERDLDELQRRVAALETKLDVAISYIGGALGRMNHPEPLTPSLIDELCDRPANLDPRATKISP